MTSGGELIASQTQRLLPILLQHLSSISRFFYQRRQPLESGLFFFGAYNPPTECLSVPRRLSLKEIPRLLVPFENCCIRVGESFTALLVGIDSGPVFFPRLKCLESCGPHQTLID